MTGTASFANPTARLVEWLAAHSIPLLVMLAAGAMIARAAERAPRTT